MPQKILTEQLNVSRETIEQFEILVTSLLKWNKSINLIGNETDIWTRHILDSAQLAKYLLKDDKIVDLGTGAGFPGLVLAIMGFDNITLIDSDSRKIAFVNYIISKLKLKCIARAIRIEKLDTLECDVITCRALMDTKTLINITEKLHVKKKYLLLKGENVDAELETIKHRAHTSITNKKSKIIEIFV